MNKRTLNLHKQTLNRACIVHFSASVKTIHFKSSLLFFAVAFLLQLTPIRGLPQEARSMVIKGTVVDEYDKPMEGVSVSVMGSDAGAVTSRQGTYTVVVSSSLSTLVFSFVGYTSQEVSVQDRRIINISLDPAGSGLSDIVVVGYGAQKKINLTGAVSTIDKRLIRNRPVTNALNALQGVSPGLIVTRANGQPGQEGWTANIRGRSSLNGTNSPLVIIDGVEGDLLQINPDDISSISVLKDAAAASIYGAKSSGGVIIITTKQGAEGKLTLNYTGLYTVKQAYNIPERLHSWEEAEMVNVAIENVLGFPNFISEQQLNWMKDPDTNFIVNPTNPSSIGYYYDLNQIPLVLRNTSPSQNHSISLSGGDRKTQYVFSLGYYDEEGVFRFGPDGTSRYNARLNLKTQFNNFLSLDSRISFAGTNTEASSAGVNGDFGLLYNIYQLRTLNPVFLPGSNDTKYAYATGGSTAYAVLKDGGYDRLSQRTASGVFTLRADHLAKGLTMRAVYSPQLRQTNDDNYTRSVPLWGFDQSGNSAVVAYVNPVNSSTKTRASQWSHDLQALADYDLFAGSSHHFHALGGFEYQYYHYDLIAAQTRALISNDVPSLNLGGNPDVPPVVFDDIQSNAWVSYFGRLNYDYKGRYLVEATLRHDISSRLAPGHRDQTFPSVSAGWLLNNERWFNNALPIFNEFKIRGSWGKLGNAQLGNANDNNYNYIAQLVNGPAYPFNNTSTPSVYQKTLPSPGLGWETIETINAGLDITLLGNRLNASFDYFKRTNNNMLIVLNVPAVLGVTPSTSNAASMKTRGWEANLNWKDRINALNYRVSLNVSDNRNEITKYLGQVIYQEGVNTAIPGMPIDAIFGYIDEGYFSTKEQVGEHAFQDNRTGPGDIRYKDVNGDNKIDGGINTADDHGDMVYLGNTSPRYNFGIMLALDWKGIDLSAFFQGTGKRNMMIYPSALVPFADSWRQPTKINQDYWTPDNQDAKFPRLYFGGNHNTRVSTHWLQDAAYIRFKNLQLGYTIPQTYTRKIKIQRARVFITGEDIWESSKMWVKYYNPENPNNASFNYPFFRSYAAGINLSL